MADMSKYETLLKRLSSLKSAAIAYSGGLDSSFLAYAAHEALGKNMLCITYRSCMYPVWEHDSALNFAKHYALPHTVIASDILAVENIAANTPQRCYYCKRFLYKTILSEAQNRGLHCTAEASNADDFRRNTAGARAARELGLVSPLAECGFTKQEIRDLSKELNLISQNAVSYACFASRIPFGEYLTLEKLSMIEKAEAFLMNLGFSPVRVRVHNMMARLELAPEQIADFTAKSAAKKAAEYLKSLGFEYVCVDLDGYRE